MDKDNIKEDILNIINSIPNDTSDLEKARYVYIKLGKLFYYDSINKDYDKKCPLDSPYISRYQTCIQISELFNEIMNKIGIKCRVIAGFDNNGVKHLANVISIDEEEFLLDLTNDLHLIQFDMRTKDFAYRDYQGEGYSIVSSRETMEMDKKLGLYPNGYTNDIIRKIKEDLSFQDYSNMSFEEIIDYRINKAKEILNHEHGYVEGNQFIYKVFIDNFMIGLVEKTKLRKENNQKDIYVISRNDDIVYYLYDELGFNKTSVNEIKSMLDDGWNNRSEKIYKYLEKGKKL